jgi:uncharacterized protein (TIGR00251 family)
LQEKSWLKSDNGDILLVVNVKTKQNEDKFEFNQEKLMIKISAPPIKGKANKKLLRLLRKKFQTEVFLESGQKSSTKVFRLKKTTLNQVLGFLENEKNKSSSH